MHEGTHGRGPGACQTDLDAVLVALAHPYRRHVLAHLAEEGRVATITSVAAGIRTASAEREGLPGPQTGIEGLESALYHVHIPKLRDAGLVACDYDEGTVRLTDRYEDVRPILRAAENL